MNFKLFILGSLALLVTVLIHVQGPMSQDPLYHHFADQKAWFGIANFLNVGSNIGFVLVGFWGLRQRNAGQRNAGQHNAGLVHENYKIPFMILSVGLILTALGSAWYHLLPTNHSLVWDRIPMTISFMALFSLVIRDYIHDGFGQKILVPAVLFGFASILYWHLTEGAGVGDLRPYVMVQFLPLLLIPVIMILFRPIYSHRGYLTVTLIFYGTAKAAEFFDASIYQTFGEMLSGHSLKHLLAAVGTFFALKTFLSGKIAFNRQSR